MLLYEMLFEINEILFNIQSPLEYSFRVPDSGFRIPATVFPVTVL